MAPQLLKCKFDKKKDTTRVANISIFLILNVEGWRTVLYRRYPTVLGPEEQRCDLKQWGRIKKKKKHLLSVFFFQQNSPCISIIAFGDKQREGWRNQKAAESEGKETMRSKGNGVRFTGVDSPAFIFCRIYGIIFTCC